MNINRKPFDLRASLRSVSASLLGEERELSHPYYVSVDEEATMQETFQRRANNMSFKDLLRSSVSSFFSDEQPPPSPRWGLPSGDPSSGGGLLRSLTQKIWSDEDDDVATTCCPNLSLTHRLIGCVSCFALGQLLQLFSLGSFASIIMGRPGTFAVNFTLGNFFMLAASFFFSNPRAQCRKLKYKNRGRIFFTYVASMVLTLLVVGSSQAGRWSVLWGLLILAMVALQWCSLVWYVLSFIPYGQTVAKKVLRSLAKVCCAL
mmetsp:Transcript_53463/g.98893  ORF Transcript_53463/g.98893 Transcript_53463/m.98893 type:complete len:261 (+) Transcript_53463:108-890(+)